MPHDPLLSPPGQTISCPKVEVGLLSIHDYLKLLTFAELDAMLGDTLCEIKGKQCFRFYYLQQMTECSSCFCFCACCLCLEKKI